MKKIGNQITYDQSNKTDLEIEIKPFLPKEKMSVLFLWGGAWSLCGFIILISLFTYGFKKEEYLAVGIFMIFWTYFEIKVIHALRWNKAGKELISIKEGEFSYLKTINGRGFPNVNNLSQVSQFHYAEDTESGLWNDINKSSWFVGGEVVEYAIEDSIKRLGLKLPKKDAIQLANLLNKTIRTNA